MTPTAYVTPNASAGAHEVREIGSADLNWALAEGWRDFRAKRGDLIFAGLLYPAICLAAILFAFNDPLLPLIFPAIAGLSIAGPAVASGFYELARRREEGLESSWWHFLDPVKGRSGQPLAVLTVCLAAFFVGWMIVAYIIFALTLGTAGPLGFGDFFARLFGTPQGWAMIVLGNAVGLGFAVAVLVLSAVSFPMVVDKPVDAATAVRTSLAAARRNPAEFAGWGVRVAALLAVGIAPFGIGLAVVLPWLGYATWHLYTRLVVR